MSELNRMLSDLVSPDHKESKVTPAVIPPVWGFRFARVVLALVVTLMGASGIAWALVENDKAVVTSESVIASPAVSLTAPSPTQKVVKNERAFVAMNLVAATPAVISEVMVDTAATLAIASQQKPAPRLVVVTPPVTITPTVVETTVKITSPMQAESSLSVEIVELNGDELADIAYETAQKRAQVGDTQKAIAYLRDAVKYNPSHIGATNQLAGLLYGRSQLRDAENVLRKGINANSKSVSLKLTLARIYQQTRREESALNVLMGNIESRDGDALRYVSLRASLAQKLGRHALAKDSYQWLTEREPNDGRWWLGLAVSAERENALSEAKQAYQSAINVGGLSDKSVQFVRQRLVYIQRQQSQDPSRKTLSNNGGLNGH